MDNEADAEGDRIIRDMDDADAAARPEAYTADQLWGHWKSYCQRRESKEPEEPCLISEFALELGLSFPDLRSFEKRGKTWKRVSKKILLDAISRMERRLLRGLGSPVGSIFWLKNRAGWRDKSVEETKDGEDWLDRVLRNKTSTTVVKDRVSAPPQPDDQSQPVDVQDDPPDLRLVSQ